MNSYFDTLANAASNPNEFTQLFNEMDSADQVRLWVQKDPWELWGEYPRGGGRFGQMLQGLLGCKFASELHELAIKEYGRWYTR